MLPSCETWRVVRRVDVVVVWNCSERYAGARLCLHLNTRTQSLYWILSWIRSQWRSISIGVICSDFLAEQISLAAALMTAWSRFRRFAGEAPSGERLQGRRSHMSWRGHDPSPTFWGKGGHNLGIIHISHIALITPLHLRQRSVVFILACGASRRQQYYFPTGGL